MTPVDVETLGIESEAWDHVRVLTRSGKWIDAGEGDVEETVKLIATAVKNGDEPS